MSLGPPSSSGSSDARSRAASVSSGASSHTRSRSLSESSASSRVSSLALSSLGFEGGPEVEIAVAGSPAAAAKMTLKPTDLNVFQKAKCIFSTVGSQQGIESQTKFEAEALQKVINHFAGTIPGYNEANIKDFDLKLTSGVLHIDLEETDPVSGA